MDDYVTEAKMLREISPLGRYAQGDYICECAKCHRRFVGDKRATQCLVCAVTVLNEFVAQKIDSADTQSR